MKNRLIFLMVCVLSQGCTKLDDYLLGKDNTPQPKALSKTEGKVNVTQKWSAEVGKVSKNNEYLRIQPTIQKEMIYVADASGLVKAVKKSDGQIAWSTTLNHGVVSGPSVASGYVAVSTNNSSLVVLNQADGKKLWQAKVSGEVLSPPTFFGKKIIVKTIDGNVYAFNATDGKQLWMSEHGSPSLVLKASSAPVILGKLILIGFSDGKLDAIEAETGRVVWQRSISYASGSSDVERLVDIDADPIIENDVVYLASYQGYIGALSLANGQFIWKKPGSVYKNMLLKANTLYLTDSQDVLWSLDKTTGKVNWKQTALKARNLTEPTFMKNDLVVADKTGYLHFIDAQTGEIKAHSKVPSGVSVSPKSIGKNLYVLTDNGMLNQLAVS